MPHDKKPEAIGGWLKGADATMQRGHRHLKDIEATALDPEHIAYFEDYRERYFNDRLVPGQGVAEMLVALVNFSARPARWADLGAGVTTLFWAIGIAGADDIVACDLVPEALTVLAQFKDGDETPPCYQEALALVGTPQDHLDAIRRQTWDFRVFDCHVPWQLPGYSDGFGLITAFGCFGIAADAAGYETAFGAAAGNLRTGGRFIGADWVRSAAFVEREGHDNAYVSQDLIAACGAAAGLQLLSLTRIAIAGDPYYDAVLVWAFSA